MRRTVAQRVTPGPASTAGPGPIRNATCLGARVAPQQSPILRAGRPTLGTAQQNINPIRVPGGRKTPGVRGLAPGKRQRIQLGKCGKVVDRFRATARQAARRCTSPAMPT